MGLIYSSSGSQDKKGWGEDMPVAMYTQWLLPPTRLSLKVFITLKIVTTGDEAFHTRTCQDNSL